MKTYLFPGQGSQRKGMGGALFDEFPELTAQASEILGYSIRELCLEDPRGELDLTQFTQPALYVVNALSYFNRMNAGAGAEQFAGHSLGEFNALMAAGCFDFAQGLRLVKRRGELFANAPQGGGMAAVVNASRAQVVAILRDNAISEIDIAVHNSPVQCVLAGPKKELARVEALFTAPPMSFHPLKTSGAFHSRYMKEVAGEFGEFLRSFEFTPPQRPVIANVTGRPYDPDRTAETLVDQICRPVLWCDTIEYLLSTPDIEFEEVGHGDVLTKIINAIVERKRPTAVGEANGTVSEAISAVERVRRWNASHSIGTRVVARAVKGKELATRTQAVVLFGHRAAVYMEGYNGYFDLEEVEVVSG